MTSCNICQSSMAYVFSEKLLNKYTVTYHQCNECGLLQTESPYWLDEAYSEAIAIADTGIVLRNFSISSKLAGLLYFVFDAKDNYIDVAGGYGILTRIMRDFGFNFYWSDKYCNNLLARGFEANTLNKPVLALTAFEVLEHVHNPVEFISSTMSDFGARTLIFTTQTFSNQVPDKDWWYYAFNTGQHISFYQIKTLKIIAEKLGLNFYSANGFHIITDKHLNLTKLKLLTSPLAFFISIFLKLKMNSKTLSDHHSLMRKMNK